MWFFNKNNNDKGTDTEYVSIKNKSNVKDSVAQYVPPKLPERYNTTYIVGIKLPVRRIVYLPNDNKVWRYKISQAELYRYRDSIYRLLETSGDSYDIRYIEKDRIVFIKAVNPQVEIMKQLDSLVKNIAACVNNPVHMLVNSQEYRMLPESRWNYGQVQ